MSTLLNLLPPKVSIPAYSPPYETSTSSTFPLLQPSTSLDPPLLLSHASILAPLPHPRLSYHLPSLSYVASTLAFLSPLETSIYSTLPSRQSFAQLDPSLLLHDAYIPTLSPPPNISIPFALHPLEPFYIIQCPH